jgi:hypothetical protein
MRAAKGHCDYEVLFAGLAPVGSVRNEVDDNFTGRTK